MRAIRSSLSASPLVRTRVGISVASSSVICALLAASSAAASPQFAAPPTAGGRNAPTTSPGQIGRLATGAPSAVPPVVKQLSVPPVARRDQAAASAKLAAVGAPSSAAPLVAHLRKPLTHRFSMVGVTWDNGTAAKGTTVSVRAHTGGTWSAWTALEIDPAEGPAPSEDNAARAGTEPAWVGPAAGVEVAVYSPSGSAPRHLSVDAIDPGTSTYDSTAARTASERTSAKSGAGPDAGTFPSLPTVITRNQWGADPSLGDSCWQPRLGDTFSMVFVHHTAGSNTYSRSESPAVVRGIYAYHTQARGWCDIGYNFLIDRYGNIYEGRRGGIRMPVRGAHAGDYNVDTTGISLMGDFTRANPTRSMKHSLVQLIAWRMGTAYHGAYGRPTVNGKVFSRISGHRDAMSTTCPGQQVYDWLPTLRDRVAVRLGDYQSPIQTRWRAMGGPHSRLGDVSIGEQGENHGRHTAFQTGRMYDSRNGGLHALYRSPVLKKYLRLGETGSGLGYPASNLHSIVNGTGSSATFLRGRIYSSPATGSTVLVRSAILKRYLDLGSAAGRLGFPTVPVHSIKNGSLARFQHGTITWVQSRHKTVVSYS
jgi:uncharacterized protein with LGFP repeats